MDINDDLQYVHNEMKTSVSFLSVCHQARAILQTKYGLQGEEVREEHITELDERLKILRVRLTEKEKSRRRNWRQLEGDLWRLEKWLEHADRQLVQHLRNGVPSNIEQLEEVIQDHREFLLDLDSHKSMAMSINVIGSHLAEHCPTLTKAEGMRLRLALVNEKWDNVCEQATLWQTRLQTALMENGEFHQTILELQQWLDSTTATIREAEPVDLSVSRPVLQGKYNKFLELLRDLHRCQPRVVSLQEAADQLELQSDSSSACKAVKTKLVVLSRSLRALIQVCSLYL